MANTPAKQAILLINLFPPEEVSLTTAAHSAVEIRNLKVWALEILIQVILLGFWCELTLSQEQNSGNGIKLNRL